MDILRSFSFIPQETFYKSKSFTMFVPLMPSPSSLLLFLFLLRRRRAPRGRCSAIHQPLVVSPVRLGRPSDSSSATGLVLRAANLPADSIYLLARRELVPSVLFPGTPTSGKTLPIEFLLFGKVTWIADPSEGLHSYCASFFRRSDRKV